jgi:hypothetical protein
MPESFDELKSSALEKMAIKQFENSREDLFFLLVGQRNGFWQGNTHLL